MTLILDWDGTVTVDDTLIVALREFGNWQVYLDGIRGASARRDHAARGDPPRRGVDHGADRRSRRLAPGKPRAAAWLP
jgi:hypothetical protein